MDVLSLKNYDDDDLPTGYKFSDSYLHYTQNFLDIRGDIILLAQPQNKNVLHYAEKIAAESLQCQDVHEKHDLNQVLVSGLDTFIEESMRGYCAR